MCLSTAMPIQLSVLQANPCRTTCVYPHGASGFCFYVCYVFVVFLSTSKTVNYLISRFKIYAKLHIFLHKGKRKRFFYSFFPKTFGKYKIKL